MSVRIDNDFWKNYAEYEELIRSCFNHIYYNKYPVNEGAESTYNYLIAEFFRKGIFDKFDAEKVGKYVQTTDSSKTDRKKFEQFIYKWSESVIGGLYLKVSNESKRYLRFSTDKLEDLTDVSYADFKNNSGMGPWAAGDEVVVTKRLDTPSISDAEDFRGEDIPSAYEQCRINELESFLQSVLKDDRERAIIEGRREGLSDVAIGKLVGVTSSQVANVVRSIRSRCTKVFA